MKTLSLLIAGMFIALAPALAVFAQTPASFEVTQEARNLTKQNFAWANMLQAEPKDRLEFRVIVTWRGARPAQNVLVQEALGQGLVYANNLKLDGVSVAGNIVEESLNIGALGTGQSKIVTFEAQTAPPETFAKALTQVVNTVTVFNADASASVFSTVQVNKAGAPTDVPTGFLNEGIIALALLMLGTAGAGAFLLLRSTIRREILESAYETRAARKLAALTEQIRKHERRSLD